MYDPSEMIDIVDEADQIIKQVVKGEAHKEGLLHRCVLALLLTTANNWVLVRQAEDRQDAGQYVFPMGGHVGAGERTEDALRREVAEELGLENFTHRFVGKTIYRRNVLGRDENHLFHFFEIRSGDTLNLGDEAIEFREFSQDELRRLMREEPHLFGHNYYFGIKTWYPHLLI